MSNFDSRESLTLKLPGQDSNLDEQNQKPIEDDREATENPYFVESITTPLDCNSFHRLQRFSRGFRGKVVERW